MKYAKSRSETVEIYSKRLVSELLTGFEYQAKQLIDLAYCEGYNTVLEHAEDVLSPENYQKLIDYLNKNGK